MNRTVEHGAHRHAGNIDESTTHSSDVVGPDSLDCNQNHTSFRRIFPRPRISRGACTCISYMYVLCHRIVPRHWLRFEQLLVATEATVRPTPTPIYLSIYLSPFWIDISKEETCLTKVSFATESALYDPRRRHEEQSVCVVVFPLPSSPPQ